MRYFIAIALSLALTACGKKDNDLTRYHEDGRAKPAIAVASVIDATSVDVPWSISDELTSMIIDRISREGTIFVVRKDNLAYTENPFGSDLSWMKREFSDNEFIVFLELVEHDQVAAAKNNKKVSEIPFETALNLKMGVRVRVIDLRGSTPKIVLQELIRDSYFIPKTDIPTNYGTVVWGTEEFAKSPMGITHAEIAQEIAQRIGEYIHLAKSR